MNITITVDDLHLTAQLAATATSEKILAVLPLEGRANTWGEEIYFEIPVDAQLADDAVTEVEVGTLAYWPTGRALCIFFGPTPVSTGNLPPSLTFSLSASPFPCGTETWGILGICTRSSWRTEMVFCCAC